MKRVLRLRIAIALASLLSVTVTAQQQGPRSRPLQTAKAMAPFDMTGYWVSVVSEDWRYRMLPPPKGDYRGIPLNADARKIADAWDPARDEAAREECKAYGAPALLRVPGRLHVTWVDDNTLKLETDAGMQTRLFRFAQTQRPARERSWQGESAATWDLADGGGIKTGSLKVTTTNLRPGYLRKNGVPYGSATVLTEYFDIAPMTSGTDVLVITSIIDDPQYLFRSYILSTQFKRQADATGWDPSPCSARW